MKKIVFLILNIYFLTSTVYADNPEPIPEPDEPAIVNNYISTYNYLQNPYTGQTSLGGTQMAAESEITTKGIWDRLFTTGTYDAAGAFSEGLYNGTNNYAAGAYIFGQTGRIGGFALGGDLAVQTPQDVGNYLGYIAATQTVEMPEAYIEYQFSDIVNADMGRVMLKTPWMNSPNPSTSAFITYQGGVVVIKPMPSLMITALGINNMGSALGFNSYTLYNTNFGYPVNTSGTTPGAIGFGLQWSPTDNYSANFWGYQMFNYVNMAYADTKYTWTLNNKTNFTFAAQGAMEIGQGNNLLNNNQFTTTPYGTVNSNILGAQFGFTYDIWSVLVGVDSMFGTGTYGNGGFVSPYTYQLVSDPLYTTSQLAGMIEKASGGNSYKIATPVALLNKNLTITPQYAYYDTTAYNPSQEFDLMAQYNLAQIKGLSLFAVYANQQSSNNNPSQGADAVNAYQLFVQYLY